MGGMMSCFKASNNQRDVEPPNDHNKKTGGPAKSRVNNTDKAILDVKSRQKNLKVYIDKLSLQQSQQLLKIQEHLKEKNKQRALIALKHKKFLEKELDKAYGANTMLEQTLMNINSAQADLNVYEALKKGDQVITELKSKASLEDFEELYEKHQEHLDRQKMEQELFGQVLNDEDLEDELAQLDALILEEELPEAAGGELQAIPRQQQQQQQQNQQVQQEKRQPVLA